MEENLNGGTESKGIPVQTPEESKSISELQAVMDAFSEGMKLRIKWWNNPKPWEYVVQKDLKGAVCVVGAQHFTEEGKPIDDIASNMIRLNAKNVESLEALSGETKDLQTVAERIREAEKERVGGEKPEGATRAKRRKKGAKSTRKSGEKDGRVVTQRASGAVPKSLGIAWSDEHIKALATQLAHRLKPMEAARAVTQQYGVDWQIETRTDEGKKRTREIQLFLTKRCNYLSYDKGAAKWREFMAEETERWRKNVRDSHRFADKSARVEALGTAIEGALKEGDWQNVGYLTQAMAKEMGELIDKSEVTNKEEYSEENLRKMPVEQLLELGRRLGEQLTTAAGGNTKAGEAGGDGTQGDKTPNGDAS